VGGVPGAGLFLSGDAGPVIPEGVSGKRIAIAAVWGIAFFAAFGCFFTVWYRIWGPYADRSDAFTATTASLLWHGTVATALMVGATVVGYRDGMFRWSWRRALEFLIELVVGMAGLYLLLRMGCFGT